MVSKASNVNEKCKMLSTFMVVVILSVTGVNGECKQGKLKHECWNVNLVDWLVIKNPQSVNKLDLKDSQLAELPRYLPESNEELFINYTNLAVLNFTRCNIRTIEKSVFANVQKLTTLMITQNFLNEVPDLHPKLIFLDLSYNQIESGLDKLQWLEGLQDLYMHHNQIHDIQYDFSDLTKLRALDLSWNQITTLPENFFRGPNGSDAHTKEYKLIKLNLQNNKLTSIGGDDLASLGNLKYLHLGNNEIETLVFNAFGTNHVLEMVSLANNKLTTVHPELFRNKSNLKRLILSGNMIKTLNQDVFLTSTGLSYLDLSSNEISLIDDQIFANLMNLEYLLIARNNISDVNMLFWPLSKIKYIDASGNIISSDLDCTNCLKLNTLKLNDNLISHIAIKLNDGFISIDLSGNKIENLNKITIRFGKRGYINLDLTNNDIKEFEVDEFLEVNQHIQHVALDASLSEDFSSKLANYKSTFWTIKKNTTSITQEIPDILPTTPEPLTTEDVTPTPDKPKPPELTTEELPTTPDKPKVPESTTEDVPTTPIPMINQRYTFLELLYCCLGTFVATTLLVGGSVCLYNCRVQKNMKMLHEYEMETRGYKGSNYENIPSE